MMTTTSKQSDEEKKCKKAEQSKRYYQAHKARICARTSAYHKENRDTRLQQQKEYALRSKYGITSEQKDAMLADQGGVCAICVTPDPGNKGWVVDHCHSTDVVRGILCNSCNVMLGHARDNKQTLSNAIKYLS